MDTRQIDRAVLLTLSTIACVSAVRYDRPVAEREITRAEATRLESVVPVP